MTLNKYDIYVLLLLANDEDLPRNVYYIMEQLGISNEPARTCIRCGRGFPPNEMDLSNAINPIIVHAMKGELTLEKTPHIKSDFHTLRNSLEPYAPSDKDFEVIEKLLGSYRTLRVS